MSRHSSFVSLADRESLQPGLVNVGHVLRVGLRHRLLAQQVRSLVRSELQIAGKQSKRQPVENHAHAGRHRSPRGTHSSCSSPSRAPLHPPCGPAPPDANRAPESPAAHPRTHSTCTLPRLPACRCGDFQNIELSRRNAPPPGRHLKIRRQILAQLDPCAARLFRAASSSTTGCPSRSASRARFSWPCSPGHTSQLHRGSPSRSRRQWLPILHVAALRLRHRSAGAQHQHHAM